MASSSEHTSAPAAAVKSSFPMDALYAPKSFKLSSPKAARRDDYVDVSYDMQSDQWPQVSRFFS